MPRLLSMGYEPLRLPLTTSIAVDGAPGAGKSTLAATVALAIAHAGTRVLYLAVEEGQGATTIERFRRARTAMGIPAPRCLVIADVATPREAQEEIRAVLASGGPVFTVIDSLTDLGASKGFLQDLLGHGRLGLLFTGHLTTGSILRGGLEPVYAVDVWLSVADLVATIRKSRWGAGANFAVLEPMQLDAPRPAVVPFPDNKE